MKEKAHLPMFGVGPFCVIVMIVPTVLAFVCRNSDLFAGGRLNSIRIPLCIAGILCALLGIYMWIHAVFRAKIDDGIKANHLVTTGIYAWVRNPIYSAFMIGCTGIILMIGNVYFFILPPLYWLFMTVLMQHTEEKWLHDLYGQEYEDYCKKVNRCIPWFPGKS